MNHAIYITNNIHKTQYKYRMYFNDAPCGMINIIHRHEVHKQLALLTPLETMTPTTEILSKLPESGWALFQRIQVFIMRIDIMIMKCDKALDELQPAHSGRIRVEWWKANSGQGLQEKRPYIAKWSRNRNGTWRAEKVGVDHLVSRAKTSGEFYETADRVKEVLTLLSELLRKRQTAVDALKRARLIIGRTVEDNEDNLKKLEDRLEGLKDS